MIEEMLWQQHRTHSKSAPQQDHGAFASKKPRTLSPLGDFGHNRSLTSAEEMWSTDGWEDNCADCGEDHEALAGQHDGHGEGQYDGHGEGHRDGPDDGMPPWRRLARRSQRFVNSGQRSDIKNGTEIFSNRYQTRLRLELDYDDL